MALMEKDSHKIPIWMGNGKDQFTAEHWIKRLENAKSANGWSDLQTVNQAHSALRDKALLFRDYLESEKLNPDDWASFRSHFLHHFGSTTVDHSKATNLVLSQKADEKANQFGWRVNTMVNEFFTSVPRNVLDLADPALNALPNEITSKVTDEDDQRTILRWVRTAASTLHEATMQSFSSSLGRVVFLNGLHLNIRSTTKLKKTTSLHEAVMAAMEAEKAVAGPTDVSKSVSAVSEQPPTESSEDPTQDVNYVNRRRNTRPGSFPASSSTSVFRKRTNMECWYCHKKGHFQVNCRLRLSRGAAIVTKPRTVQEIQHDKYAYQGDEDESEEPEETSEVEEISTDVASLSFNHLN